MDDKELKKYHAFCIDCWQYFKKYAWDGVNAGVNDINFWDACADADALLKKYNGYSNAPALVSAIQDELWEIGGAPKWSKERCDELFQYCRFKGKESLQYLMHWIDKVTAKCPESAAYILDKLADYLQDIGVQITRDELKAYADAGWILRV